MDPFEKASTLCLNSLVEYSPHGIISKRVLEKTSGNITLFSFDKDQKLSEHTSPFDAFIHVLEGEGHIYINGNLNKVGTGCSIIMPANSPHAVVAPEPFKMLLVLLKTESPRT